MPHTGLYSVVLRHRLKQTESKVPKVGVGGDFVVLEGEGQTPSRNLATTEKIS